jgi:hypothetical protein
VVNYRVTTNNALLTLTFFSSQGKITLNKTFLSATGSEPKKLNLNDIQTDSPTS